MTTFIFSIQQFNALEGKEKKMKHRTLKITTEKKTTYQYLAFHPVDTQWQHYYPLLSSLPYLDLNNITKHTR